jgi:Gas vesicle protein K/Lsr2
MATVTKAQLTCGVCGDTKNVKTRTFELDGQAYVIDLCRKDGNALDRVATRYTAKARKVGSTLMALEDRMAELRDRFGLTVEDLNLDLGPLGPLLPREGR